MEAYMATSSKRQRVKSKFKVYAKKCTFDYIHKTIRHTQVHNQIHNVDELKQQCIVEIPDSSARLSITHIVNLAVE